jgi:hypothetical protein
MIVSNGSTLGTTSGILSKLAVLAIDNAGTVELAVVNANAYGLLDERSLISTTAEGGVGAADSGSVIYSTTARTNVPFRIIGYVESTQATAGAWATSPSNVAGMGGGIVPQPAPVITSDTAVTSTSGTSIDFTGIPAWVKKITVMFSGVSLSGTDNLLVQIGSGSLSTSGYVSGGFGYGTTVNSTAGFIIPSASAARLTTAQVVITNISGNVWIASCVYGADVATVGGGVSTGNITLGNTLDRVSVTRTGTNTFDAGTINILYE